MNRKSSKIYLGPSWGRLGGVLGRLGGVLGQLGASYPHLEASWMRLGASWARLGGVLTSKTPSKGTWFDKEREARYVDE